MSSKGEFRLVENPKDAEILLREGVKGHCATLIWTPEQDLIFNTRLSGLDLNGRSLTTRIPKEGEIHRLRGKDAFFRISLARASVFFKTAFAGVDSRGASFWYPEKIFKVQRRRHLRLPFPEEAGRMVTLLHPGERGIRVERIMLDVSAGGLSFLVSDNEAPAFASGIVLEKVSFSLKGRSFTTSAEIRHIQAMPGDPPRPGVKIGVQFRDLKAGDSDFIASYVLRRSPRLGAA
jgi:hypothetical protein